MLITSWLGRRFGITDLYADCGDGYTMRAFKTWRIIHTEKDKIFKRKNLVNRCVILWLLYSYN